MISKNKTKKQSTSMFGIDDCHNPKKNTKKNIDLRGLLKIKQLKILINLILIRILFYSLMI